MAFILPRKIKVVFFIWLIVESSASFATIRVWTAQPNFNTSTAGVLLGGSQLCSLDTIVFVGKQVQGIDFHYVWTVIESKYGDTITRPTRNSVTVSRFPTSNDDSYYIQLHGDSSGAILDVSYSYLKVDAPVVDLTVSPGPNVCEGTKIKLSASVSGAFNYTVQWNTGQTSDTISTVQSGNYSLLVTETDNVAQCQTRTTVGINVYVVPSLSAGGTVVRCFDSPLTLMAVDSKNSATTYSWNQNQTTHLDPSTINTQNAVVMKNSSLIPITYTVTGTSGGAANCSSTATVTVKVNPLFTVNILPTDTTLCKFAPAQLPLLISGGSPFSGNAYSYAWTPNKGISDSTSQNPYFSALSVSGVKYKLTATDSKNCKATDSVLVQKTDFSVQFKGLKDSLSICYGNSTDINLNIVKGVAPFNYNWGPASILLKFNDTSYTTTTLTSNVLVKASVTDSKGCLDRDSVNIFIKPIPVPNVPGGVIYACIGTKKNIDVTPIGKTAKDFKAVQWNPITDLQGINSLTPVFTPEGIETSVNYTVAITDLTGCTGQSNITIATKNPIQSKIVLPTDHVFVGDSPSLSTNDTPDATYVWDIKNIPGTLSGANVNPRFDVANKYKIYLTTFDQFGCSTEDSTVLKVYTKGSQLFVPTAFSPAVSDTNNRVFKIFADSSIIENNFHVYIYNNFGQQVFDGDYITMSKSGWTGEGFSAGVYTSVVVNGKKQPLTSPLTLIK